MKFSLERDLYPLVNQSALSMKADNIVFKYIESEKPLIGFLVSKKFGKAHERNLFKRRCRFAFQQNFIKKNINYSIIIRPASPSISWHSINRSFALLLDKVLKK